MTSLEKLKELVDHFGGPKPFAIEAEVSWRAVYDWLAGKNKPPGKLVELLHEKHIRGGF